MTTMIVNKPYFPSLLLSPDESRDRNGPVVPDISGNVTVVSGQYGQAWRNQVAGTPGVIEHPSDVLIPQQGTMLIRLKHPIENAVYPWRIGNQNLGSTQALFGARMTTTDFRLRTTGSLTAGWPATASATPTPDAWYTTVLRWTPDAISIDFGTGDGWKSIPRAEDPALPFTTPIRLGSWLVTSANRLSTIDIEAALFYDTALSDEEVDSIKAMPEAWTWRRLGEVITRPEEITLPPPDLNAGPMRGIIHIEDETFITDRDNQERIPVEGVEILPNWDIDRAGSKGAAQITAEGGVLEPGMWLSTYRTITPERGEIIRYPRGHWHLANPGITYDGGYEMDTGAVSQVQTANASDIVDDLAGVSLREAFYTPRQGHVMTDVHNLIQMGSCGIMGPNLLTNGSFEDDSTGWTGGYDLGGSGSVAYTANSVGIPFDAPDKTKFAQVTFSPNMPAGATRWWLQSRPIPPGTQVMYASAVMMTLGWAVPRLALRFFGESGAQVSQFNRTFPGSVFNRWYRYMIFAPVPPGAVSCAVLPVFTYQVDGPAWNESCAVDDVRLGTCTHMPMPDDRINLPATDAVASTRIQTAENKNLLYDAINADRLSAIGHYALATDMEGHLTSQPIRTLANATPRYTFGPNDIEIVDDVSPEIIASNTRPYNHWFAVKEDFEDASASMRADSYNNNANDRFSVVNSGGISSAPQITVQDAVSVDALQAIADRARDSYSLSETVRFAIMPLDLTVYDVVAIDDPDMPDISGVWAVNSIDASGDYLVITATRAVSREV